MRILHISTVPQWGGAARVARALHDRQRERGIRSTLLFGLGAHTEEMTLTIVGRGTTEDIRRIKRLISESNLESKVEIKGLVDRAEIPLMFREADIFSAPSRNEALGVAILEALASGTPVVASNVGGIPEVLDHGKAGWMGPPGDALEVSRALLQVIRDTGQRRQKQRRGFEHVESFSKEKMIEGIKEISAE